MTKLDMLDLSIQAEFKKLNSLPAGPQKDAMMKSLQIRQAALTKERSDGEQEKPDSQTNRQARTP